MKLRFSVHTGREQLLLRSFQTTNTNKPINTMAIHYNVIQRPEPGVEGGGEQNYYASAITTGNFDIDGLTERIEKISTVSGTDIRAVFTVLWMRFPKSCRRAELSAWETWAHFV